MTTVALIFPTPSKAFLAFSVVSDLCEVVVLSSPESADRLDVPVQAVFVEASMLTRESVAGLLQQLSPDTTRIFALLSPDVPMFEAQNLSLENVGVVHGPLTTSLALKCLSGLPGIRIPNEHPSFLLNAANDRT